MNKGLKSSLRTFVCIVTAVMTVGGFIFECQAQALENSKFNIENGLKSIFVPEILSPVNSIYVRSQKLVANDAAAMDHFGWSVAISGNLAIVGAYNDNSGKGSAYIYVRDGETWRLEDKIEASDGVSNELFGYSVDIDGDTAIVGAIYSFGNRKGAAYVFTRSCTPTACEWIERTKLFLLETEPDYPGDTHTGAYFGLSVAIKGNRAIVGAPADTTASSGSGSASVFQRSGSSWIRLDKIIYEGSNGGFFPSFGNTVAISGDTAIIGAPVSGTGGQGSAFIYGAGVLDWIMQKEFLGIAGGLGYGVAIDGNTVVVGQRSRAYTSVRTSGVWSNLSALPVDGPGFTVDIDGDTIIAGTETSAIAYVFRKINGLWTHRATLTQNGFFGRSVGVSGNKIIGGAYAESITATQQGTASIFSNVGPRPFDFNGGGVSDVSVFRPSTSDWFSTDPITGGYSEIHYGTAGDEIAPADFDGDGKTDIAVFRPSEGVWYILNSSTSQTSFVSWGLSGDVPMPNDFDNDGKADVALFRPSNSTWYWVNSSNQQTNAVQFGQSGDAPLMADFDGDARGELAVFRAASATFTWFNINTSQTGTQTFGLSTDIPTPGDFDGDLKTDIAIFRPSNAEWYRINSSNGQLVIFAFGAPGDVPTVADFDGDGETDAAVFRLSTRVWYISNSSFYDSYSLGPQFTITSFGLSGDVAVPATYLP